MVSVSAICISILRDFHIYSEILFRFLANLSCMKTGILGAIYANKGDSVELEKLTQLYMNSAEYTSEHWLIFGFHYYVMKKYDKASYFAHKACYMNPRNVEACLLKGWIFCYSCNLLLLFLF